MNAISDFCQRYPLPIYYLLTFVISWGAVLLVIGGPAAIPGTPEESKRLLPIGVMAMLLGPSVSGLLLTWAVHGRAGLREMFQSMRRWRVGLPWYVIALLTAPAVMLASMLALTISNPGYLPGIVSAPGSAGLLAMGIAFGLAAGFFEEVGWTGFVLPLLRPRYSLPATGLIMGFLWGAWHLIVNFWGSGDANGLISLELLLPALFWSFVILPAYRVLMVWVHEHTASLLVAMLMHMSLTASMITLNPRDGALQLIYVASFGSLLVMFALFTAARSGRRSQPPPLGLET